jgi:hypothetical protein
MTYKFYLKDIPEPYTVWRYITDNTDLRECMDRVKPSVDPSKLLNLNHNFNIPDIISSVDEMTEKYGFKGWLTEEGRNPSYGGLSLVCNPDYIDDIDINAHTLGTTRNKPTEFFYAKVGNYVSLRNTYFDSYAFRHHSPCVTETKFHDFIKGFKRSHVRSRIATINSEHVTNPDFSWHRDEHVFENLRINIPIHTNETFMFQIEKQLPEHLSVGNCYSWDTNIPHRVFPTNNEEMARTHIVLGFSPWFDYDPVEDSYTSNEFYGKMHPIDMLIEGHVHEGIKGLKNA